MASEPRRAAPANDKPLDPWAESEPLYGRREREHALSSHPGTPPTGNLAVKPPHDDVRAPRVAARASWPAPAARPAPREASGDEGPLFTLAETIRVEMETGSRGKWVCGLCEKAADAGAMVSLRSAIWQGFGLPPIGSRVRLLVAPRRAQSFTIHARVVPCASDARAGTFKVRLEIDTNDPVALTQWRSAIDRARTS